MTHDQAQILMDELDDLLEAERDALLAGKIDRIAPLIEDKDRVVGALNALETPPDGLDLLHGKLDRNQTLLNGALIGIKRVATRIATLRRIRETLETYDSEGKRRTIQGEVVRKVEKRA